MTDTLAAGPPPIDGQMTGQPGIRILAQYIRDVSFENQTRPTRFARRRRRHKST